MSQVQQRVSIAARAISMLMHPFMAPIYAMIIIVTAPNMWFISPSSKMLLIAIVAINALLLPALGIALMRISGVITNLSFDERRERNIPLLIVMMGYLLSAYIWQDVPEAIFVRQFLFAAVISVWVATAITYFWKICLHMVAAGGLLALVVLMAISSSGIGTAMLCTAIIVTGALASARLYLGYHNEWQTLVGFLVGFFTTSLAVLLL